MNTSFHIVGNFARINFCELHILGNFAEYNLLRISSKRWNRESFFRQKFLPLKYIISAQTFIYGPGGRGGVLSIFSYWDVHLLLGYGFRLFSLQSGYQEKAIFLKPVVKSVIPLFFKWSFYVLECTFCGCFWSRLSCEGKNSEAGWKNYSLEWTPPNNWNLKVKLPPPPRVYGLRRRTVNMLHKQVA